MILSKETVSRVTATPGLIIPGGHSFTLPEKVIQFGTGVLLRGLPDYFIDKANRNGVFNGRIVVVKSTDKGGTEAFSNQDGMYTLCVRGLEDGKHIDKKIINSSISRVLSADKEWLEILFCASNKDLQVIISNTTETGIRLAKDDLISSPPPSSFPGKLLAFLYQRYKVFNGSSDSGMVILPTELVPDNGTLLKEICIQLAEINQCDKDFIKWLIESNDFCNTLVDRIVPGALPPKERQSIEKSLGYEDDLMIMAEPYCLWAIETSSERTKEVLSFAQADSRVVVAENINKHREIKLRLLNASHTFSCALAIWSGFSTVKEAMQDQAFRSFISRLMHKEIIPSMIGGEINANEAKAFADKVLDRFSNPYINHEWINISLQYTSKILMRCIPLLLSHYQRSNTPPGCIALGFAAYVLFMNSKKTEENNYSGTIRGKDYLLLDERASVLFEHWKKEDPALVIHSVLSDVSLWKTDLTTLPDFEKLVLSSLLLLRSNGYKKLLQKELIIL